MNKCILIGRIATDPELKYTTGGIAVATFRLAVPRPYYTTPRGVEPETDFIDVVVWRNNAEYVCNYMEKGRMLSVEGRLQIRTWTAQDGTKRRTSEVVASDVQALDKAPQTQSHSERTTIKQDIRELSPSGQMALAGVGGNGDADEDRDYNFLDPFADE